MKTILLLALPLLLSGCACTKKTEKQLPPATQTGADTFGCKINGVIYKCSGTWTGREILTDEGVSYSFLNNEVGIVALTKNPKVNISMAFKCNEANPGIYTEGIRVYDTNPMDDSNSKFTITRFDNNIISGYFQMDIQFSDGTVWHITEGRFDIKR